MIGPAVRDPIQLGDFLNPASMLTPGFAGAVAMMISNTLVHAFGLPPAWSALVLSFLLGSIVWVASVSLLRGAVYYVLNSLIIFSVAFGPILWGWARPEQICRLTSRRPLTPRKFPQ